MKIVSEKTTKKTPQRRLPQAHEPLLSPFHFWIGAEQSPIPRLKTAVKYINRHHFKVIFIIIFNYSQAHCVSGLTL